jgi:hypothetical protein
MPFMHFSTQNKYFVMVGFFLVVALVWRMAREKQEIVRNRESVCELEDLKCSAYIHLRIYTVKCARDVNTVTLWFDRLIFDYGVERETTRRCLYSMVGIGMMRR